MGPDGRLGARVPPHAPSPSPLAQGPFRRQTPEVGAVCGKAARTDLCGGRAVMRVPTAIEALCLRRRAPQDEGGGFSNQDSEWCGDLRGLDLNGMRSNEESRAGTS